MSEFILQEDGTSKIILEDASGDLLKEFGEIDPSFIGTAGSVFAPNVYYTNTVVLATAGTFSWLCPAGITTVEADCYGGGGGSNTSTSNAGHAGGGGGAFAGRVAVPVTPGTVYTIVVGAAGSTGSGVSGGDSTFTGDSAVTVVAKGGKSPADGDQTAGVGGLASGSTGDVGLVFSGGNGGAGLASSSTNGAGGGASGNRLATGANGANAGGQTGGAGANGGGSGGNGSQYNTNDGQPGQAPGGGAGGGGGFISGYTGAAGQVTISVTSPTVTVPFIASVTVVDAVTISSTVVFAPFIGSVTIVYVPHLKATFTGGDVSQVALETLASDSDTKAYLSQVTLELVVPNYKGLHVWERN